MQGRSVPADERERAVRDSTRAVVADRNLCRQIAAALFTDPEPIERAFEGEPVLEVMGMFVWCLDHGHESDFDPARILPAWARKRGRGSWRTPRAGLRTWEGNSPREDSEIQAALENGTIRCRVESMWQCAACSERFRGEPYEAQEGNGTFHAGDTLCPGCAKRHGAA